MRYPLIDLSYPNLLNLFRPHLDPRRSESASFLIWFLENYYRLDSVDAIDSVCDQNGDKGVDGIYVNDNSNTIDVLQSKISQKDSTTIGDTVLKEFQGTLSQFKSKDALENMVKSAGNVQVAQLVNRLSLSEKLSSYDLRGIFLSNVNIDANGEAFLKTCPCITFIGRKQLLDTYISDKRDYPQEGTAMFNVLGFPISEYIADATTKAVIAPVKASELVILKGIADQSLFALNVRGSLGKTQVNKDIVMSIKEPAMHKTFPLYHNGITVVAKKVEKNNEKIEITDYFVVNGCQSLTALFDHKDILTDDLRVLTKFIQVDPTSKLSASITSYSNNQNGVKARDFKSNNTIQIRLQNEFRENYLDQFAYEIKRGEPTQTGESISNEEAGLCLIAFDLKLPWTTHRKYQVFDEKYSDIFCRPEVNADRIVLCYTLENVIKRIIPTISNQLFAKYAITRYAILYMLRTILEKDVVGKQIIQNPEKFVRDINKRNLFVALISRVVNDMVIDINAEIAELGDDFDYRGKLRDKDFVGKLTKDVVGSYEKLVSRNRIKPLSEEWKCDGA